MSCSHAALYTISLKESEKNTLNSTLKDQPHPTTKTHLINLLNLKNHRGRFLRVDDRLRLDKENSSHYLPNALSLTSLRKKPHLYHVHTRLIIIIIVLFHLLHLHLLAPVARTPVGCLCAGSCPCRIRKWKSRRGTKKK